MGTAFYPVGSKMSTPWLAQPPVTLYDAMPAGVGSSLSLWFDMRDLKRAQLEIISSLNRAVVVQLVGNGVQNFATARAMGAPQYIEIGGPLPVTPSAIDIGIGTNDDWHQYIGVIITTTLAAASGKITIMMYSQK